MKAIHAPSLPAPLHLPALNLAAVREGAAILVPASIRVVGVCVCVIRFITLQQVYVSGDCALDTFVPCFRFVPITRNYQGFSRAGSNLAGRVGSADPIRPVRFRDVLTRPDPTRQNFEPS